MLQVTPTVSGGILWANLHLLFWLSLVPFVTGWMGENHFSAMPTALYGFVLLMAAIAYFVLQTAIIAKNGHDSVLAVAIGSDWKGRLSPVAYLIALPMAFINEHISDLIYIGVALVWLVPDRRVERALSSGALSVGE